MTWIPFVISEALKGMLRNRAVVAATIITVAVCTVLVSVSLLLRAQVNTMKDYWYDRVEVSAFVCSPASTSPACPAGLAVNRNEIEAKIKASPLTDTVYFENAQEAYTHFQQQFANSALARTATVEQMPESFRIKLKDPSQSAAMVDYLSGTVGIEDVQDQRASLKRVFGFLSGLQVAAGSIATAMAVVTALLTFVATRAAAWSRRKEIRVMRLLGSSPTLVNAPLLTEAGIAAVIGAGVAVAVVVALKAWVIDGILAAGSALTNFVTWADVAGIVGVVTVIIVFFTVLTAWLAVRRQQRV